MADPSALPVSNPELTAAVIQISSFLSHLTVGGASAHILEAIKNSALGGNVWTLLNKRAKVFVGAAIAFAGSMGVTATFQHDPHAQAGAYTILLTGLTGPSLLQHAWSFVQSWILQTGWYRRVIQPQEITGTPINVNHPQAPPVPVPVVEVHP